MTAPIHRVHGLADDEAAPDWPPLTQAEVAALLARFPQLRGPFTLTWRSPRPFSAAARVRTSNGEVFVKRHHVDVRSPATLQVEHHLIGHLRRHGAPIPAVLADANGDTAIADGAWTYEVHALAHGIDLYRDSASWSPLTHLGQARAAGRTLAQLHQAARSFDDDARDACPLVTRAATLRAPDLTQAVEQQCAQRPALWTYLQRRPWHRDFAALQARHQALQPRVVGLPRLWTHNDWHVSNLFWSDAGDNAQVTAILDFGLAAPTFALFDLATAIERNAIAWLHLERGTDATFPATAQALIAGYAEILPLAATDLALLADLLPLAHVDFALSEIEYFDGITHSPARADVAYTTFLLGHAAWFDTPPAQQLLRAIRTPAAT